MIKNLGLIAAAALASAPMNGAVLRAAPPAASQAGPPPSGGTISIEAHTADGSIDPALPSFVDAAAQALTARGFTVFEDPGHAASVVELVLSRGVVGTGMGRLPGQPGVSPFGTGLSVPLSTGSSDLVSVRRTRLEMRFSRRGEPGLVWDGAAVTVRNTSLRNGGARAVAADLIRALLESYPVEPKGVVGVP